MIPEAKPPGPPFMIAVAKPPGPPFMIAADLLSYVLKIHHDHESG